jgi:hypothetical protein
MSAFQLHGMVGASGVRAFCLKKPAMTSLIYLFLAEKQLNLPYF